MNSNQDRHISWDELPTTITNYLIGHAAKDTTAAIAAFAPDAVVTDEGQHYRGRDRIGEWLDGAAADYTFTTEFTGATARDATHVDVSQRLVGDFPGGTADLRFRFTMDGALIARLVIEG